MRQGWNFSDELGGGAHRGSIPLDVSFHRSDEVHLGLVASVLMPRGLRRTGSKDRKRICRSVVRRYGRAHQRSVGDGFFVDEIFYVLDCFHCGLRLHPDTLTLDHVVPVARGGDNSVFNFVPSCQPCNSRRGCVPLGEDDLTRIKSAPLIEDEIRLQMSTK